MFSEPLDGNPQVRAVQEIEAICPGPRQTQTTPSPPSEQSCGGGFAVSSAPVTEMQDYVVTLPHSAPTHLTGLRPAGGVRSMISTHRRFRADSFIPV